MFTRAFALAAVLLSAASCAPNRSALSIQAVCFPTDDCTFSSTCDKQFIGSYQVASAGGALKVYLQVANRIADNEDPAVGRVNSNDAHVTGANVEFENGASGTVTLETVANQWIPAGGSAVIGVTLAVPATSTANLRLTGYYDNGNDFETGPFPLNVTVGAVSDCPTGTVATCPYSGVITRVQLPTACAAP